MRQVFELEDLSVSLDNVWGHLRYYTSGTNKNKFLTGGDIDVIIKYKASDNLEIEVYNQNLGTDFDWNQITFKLSLGNAIIKFGNCSIESDINDLNYDGISVEYPIMQQTLTLFAGVDTTTYFSLSNPTIKAIKLNGEKNDVEYSYLHISQDTKSDRNEISLSGKCNDIKYYATVNVSDVNDRNYLSLQKDNFRLEYNNYDDIRGGVSGTTTFKKLKYYLDDENKKFVEFSDFNFADNTSESWIDFYTEFISSRLLE